MRNVFFSKPSVLYKVTGTSKQILLVPCLDSGLPDDPPFSPHLHYMYVYRLDPPLLRSEQIFTRTWLRYVRVFAVVISSVWRLSDVCLSSVTLVHPTQGVEPFGKISSPLCTLAILWPPCKILRISSQGNPSVGGVKRKRGIKIERFRTYRRLYLTNGTR